MHILSKSTAVLVLYGKSYISHDNRYISFDFVRGC